MHGTVHGTVRVEAWYGCEGGGTVRVGAWYVGSGGAPIFYEGGGGVSVEEVYAPKRNAKSLRKN